MVIPLCSVMRSAGAGTIKAKITLNLVFVVGLISRRAGYDTQSWDKPTISLM